MSNGSKSAIHDKPISTQSGLSRKAAIGQKRTASPALCFSQNPPTGRQS